jgi:hypothetical protein
VSRRRRGGARRSSSCLDLVALVALVTLALSQLMLVVRSCLFGVLRLARLFLCAVLWPAMRFVICAALQLPLLALGAMSHGIFLLVPRPALRCVLTARSSRLGLRALNLGLRPAGGDRRRRLRRLRWPAHLGVAMPAYRLRSLLSSWRGGRCRWPRGRRGLRSRWGAPLSLGRRSAPLGVRWALLHRLGPLWIEVRTLP